MKIKKYGDLKNIKNNMVVDISKLRINQMQMAIGFLAGLTLRKGSLTKVGCYKYLVKMEG